MELSGVNQPTVVIVSDDPEFSGAISSRWRTERFAPTFTLMSGDLCQSLSSDDFDLAIVGAINPDLHSRLLRTLDQTGKPVILLCAESDTAETLSKHPRLIVLHRYEAWQETLVLIASEVLRRGDALERLRRAEQTNAVLERQAALGRYVIEMRHNLNNALTSILGNAELLAMDAGSFTPQKLSQVETIRIMTLRMHEILQRFSSLEKELSVVARQAEKETIAKSQAATVW
jgi:signal transduction histidine kinase